MRTRRRARWAPWWRLVQALAAGALLPFAFAPFELWPLAIVCPAMLMQLWHQCAPRRAAELGSGFGVGYFGVGTWWLYISIHGFGGAPAWLAVGLIVLLVAFMASYYGFLGWFTARVAPAAGPWRSYAGLPAAWLLLEWLRGWLLSGFPWLSLGYTQADTWLAGYAPIIGVYGLSALLLVQAGALLVLCQGRGRARLGALALTVVIWGGGWLLGQLAWTRPFGAPVPVALVQGAIPQDAKWQLNNRVPTMALYRKLNDQALGARLIVWPEAAIPELANEIPRYLADIQASARSRAGDVVMGIVRLADNGEDYYNSIIALTGNVVFYDKRHLVPFAEYFPVPAAVRSWLRLMSLPYSDFTAGAELQPPLPAGGLHLAASICYEDAYGSAQLYQVARSDLLVNVTNDAWFGRSPARYQHLQIGRMRAIEVGRYLLRAGNDGVSAIIGPKGELVAVAPEYQPVVLRGTVVARRGLSPYLRLGNWPVLLTALAALALAAWRRRAQISLAD